ncbi:MAG: hypothetical protein LBC72_01135 [Spirochaetaceae bacterium]|nr:hypothetical protein [Spirochaetaceae bacterium]
MNILTDCRNILEIVFLFFFFAISGWAGESLMETCVRRRLVNKGVFKGPWVPVHGFGAFAVILCAMPFKAHPLAVFFLCALLCTAVEYIAALVLEHGFKVKGWDYATYPYASWCNYKGRVALTTSVLFGLVGFAVVYFYLDWGRALCAVLPFPLLAALDAVLCAAFIADVIVTSGGYLRNKKLGIVNKTIGVEAPVSESFNDLAGDIIQSEKFAECKAFIQHGNVSVFTHCILVARLSWRAARFFNLPDRRSLVRAALLHDFFLYDWHTPEKMWSLHGWTHPTTAAENAREFFDISEKEYSLIQTHMWPWTPLHLPRHAEGWIICLADKVISLGETLRLIRQKAPAPYVPPPRS